MTYTVRDENGTLIAKVSNRVAQGIIEKIDGEFFRYTGGDKPVVAFRINDDILFGDMDEFGFIGYFWKNSILIPNSKD